jgi:hypothetical protein
MGLGFREVCASHDAFLTKLLVMFSR